MEHVARGWESRSEEDVGIYSTADAGFIAGFMDFPDDWEETAV